MGIMDGVVDMTGSRVELVRTRTRTPHDNMAGSTLDSSEGDLLNTIQGTIRFGHEKE